MGLGRNSDGKLVNKFLSKRVAVHSSDAYKTFNVDGVCRPANRVTIPTPAESFIASYKRTFTNPDKDISGDVLGKLTDEFDMSDIVLNQTTGDENKLKFYNTEVDNVDFTN